MALGFRPASGNLLLDCFLRATALTGAAALFMKLHTGDPGAAGTANAATETTRKSITFAAASGAIAASSNAQSWVSVAATETYTRFSLWDDVTAGVFQISGTVTGGAVTIGNTFTIASGSTTITLNAAA